MFTDNHYIAINGNWIPPKLISPGSFSAYLEPVAIKEWRDGNGKKQTKYYPNPELVVSFQTSDLDDELVSELLEYVYEELTSERICSITAYIRELDEYKTQDCRVNPLVPVLDRHTGRNGNVWKAYSITARGLGGAVT